MQRHFSITLIVVLLAVLSGACAVHTAPLTAKQQQVLDYVKANWGQDTAVTGIDLAMDIVGGTYDVEDRYALGVYLREHPEVHRVIRRFGWETVALTPVEKRIARLLSRAEREHQPPPSVAQLVRSLEVQPGAITDGLRLLERFEIIRREASAGGVGYRMAKSRYVNWEGAMRITFMAHRVNVHGVKRLDTY